MDELEGAGPRPWGLLFWEPLTGLTSLALLLRGGPPGLGQRPLWPEGSGLCCTLAPSGPKAAGGRISWETSLVTSTK